MLRRKKFEYMTEVIEDRSYLNDPGLLRMLNHYGRYGWKRSELQPMGASKMVVMLEREVEYEVESDAPVPQAPTYIEEEGG